MSNWTGRDRGPQGKALASAWAVAGLVVLQVLAYTGQSVLVSATRVASGVYDYDVSSAVLLTEAVKLLVALGALVRRNEHHVLALNVLDDFDLPIKRRADTPCSPKALTAVRLLQRSLVYVLPAFLYMVHNSLVFVAHLYLSAPMYQLMSNTKIIATGVVYRVLLQRRLLVIQWIALAQLAIGVACTSLDYDVGCEASASASARGSAWRRGLAAMVLLATCSALAGACAEVLVKTSGLPVQAGNAWLYAYSTLASALAFVWRRPAERRLLDGYTPLVWAMVLANSTFGIAVSFTSKHGDNTVKLFGASLAIPLTSAASSQFLGTSTGPGLWLGCGLTACALCLYYGDQQALHSIDSDAAGPYLARSGLARRRAGRAEEDEDPKLV